MTQTSAYLRIFSSKLLVLCLQICHNGKLTRSKSYKTQITKQNNVYLHFTTDAILPVS